MSRELRDHRKGDIVLLLREDSQAIVEIEEIDELRGRIRVCALWFDRVTGAILNTTLCWFVKPHRPENRKPQY